jgi:hypothetical protein
MKIVIYTFAENFTLQLAIELIPKGVEPVEVTTREEVLEFLKNQNDEAIILLSESSELEFLKQAKEIKSNTYIFLIYHGSFKSAELMELMKIGITSLIEYSDNPAKIVDDIIQNIIRNNIRINERRKHLRITPSPYEEVTASIYIKNINRFVHGSLIDISAGGVAVKLKDSIEASILIINQIYDPLLLHIRGMEIKTISRLIGKRGAMAGFKFENVEEKDMRKIATYIHMRIGENTKKLINELLKTK